MASLIGLPAIQYPRNALLDFSPITSAMENAQQQEAMNRRAAIEGERLGWDRQRQPLELDSMRAQLEAARDAAGHNRLLRPLQLRQTQTEVAQAEEALSEIRQRRREADELMGLTPAGPTPTSAPGISVTAPARAAAAPAATSTPAASSPPQNQPNVGEAGARFIQSHILGAPPEVGQARFRMLMDDPVFGPAIQANGLHQMPWDEAARTMAGVTVSPTTQPAAPAAVPSSAPLAPQAGTPPQAPRNMREVLAARSDAERRLFATTYRKDPAAAFALLNQWETPKLDIKEVGGRLVATDPRGLAAPRVVYDPGTIPDSGVNANISGGLNDLASIPGRYGGDSGVFGSAVGTYQGDPTEYSGVSAFTPSSMAQSVGRAWGNVSSLWAGGPSGSNPREVRDAITGSQNTLSSVLKPLIRKPGEGAWTDADQKRLDTIVGNLTQARTVEQYNRELENVRQRINSNFNLQLPPIPGVTPKPNATPGAQTQAQPATAPAARITNDAEYNALPSGTRFTGPDGKLRIKP